MAFLLPDVNPRLLGSLLATCLFVTVAVSAQSATRNVRLGIFGYVVLPNEYKAYRTNDLRDAWSGYIVAPNNKTMVFWSAGLVQTPFDNGDDKFVWVKRENVGNTVLKYGLLHANDNDIVAATVPGLNLVMVLRSDNDLDLFLKIARSFRRDKCRNCERPLRQVLCSGPSNKSLDRSHGKRVSHQA